MTSIENKKIGFIGGGNMATSLIGGLIKLGQMSGEQIILFEPNREKGQALRDEYGLALANDNQQLVASTDVVVIAVKPQVLQAVLEPLVAEFSQYTPLIISIVAGIRADSIEAWVDTPLPIVRVMPNTPALIGMGASGLYANQHVSTEQRGLTELLINSVGTSAWVTSEADIDSVTALSGSGPAYFMLFIQGLIEAAETAGMDSDTAKTLAIQTATGAAELVASSTLPLQTLIDNVTSPNGTTEQALLSFANNNLKGIVAAAFEAAKQRSEELANELG